MTTPRKLIQNVIRELDRRFGMERTGDLSIQLLQADQLLGESERAMNVDPADRWPSMPAVEIADGSTARRRPNPTTHRRGFRIHQGGKHRFARVPGEDGLGLVS